VAAYPVPTGREEDWRFTPLDRLAPLLEDQATGHHLDVSSELPPGVSLTTLSADDARLRTAAVPVDRASALAIAHSDGALLLSIPAETVVTDPIVIRLSGRGEVVHGHLMVEAGAFSSATVVIEHAGSARYSGSVSLDVKDGARLDTVLFQDWADDAVHTGHVATKVGRDARSRTFAVTLGGRTVRLVQTVEYVAAGGDAEAFGIYFADADQHLEHRLFVDHAIPHCRSRVTFKGALQGEQAHAVWIGDVLIRAAAIGTDTYELNRNLVLTDGTRVDSVPNLEIETGEIAGAGHASATGRFDDEQLFYLQARGIPADEARRLVVRGFFAEILGELDLPELTERIGARLEAELSRSGS
jgi:Fe-S cluster assembly protein SufD